MASHDAWMKALRAVSDQLEQPGGNDDAAEDFIDFCRAVGRRDANAISAARGFAAAIDDEVWK